MALTSTQFTSQIIIFFRDLIRDNATDPITRSGNEKFVMTSYPQRPVKYPIITTKLDNIVDSKRLGMQSEGKQVTINLEVRIWGRNEKEKNEIFDGIYNILQTKDLGSGGMVEEGIYNYNIISTTDLDEEGEQNIKSRIITLQVFTIVDTT